VCTSWSPESPHFPQPHRLQHDTQDSLGVGSL